MSNFSENKDLYSTILSVLKKLGVKVPKFKNFKAALLKLDESTSQLDTQMFGVSLFSQEWTYESGYPLPKFLALSTAYLEKFSKMLGLFRKSGSMARQRNLRIKLRNGESLEGCDPNDVASLLKQWLRELPEPLIPCCMHDLFIRCQQLNGEDRVTASLLSCLLLPREYLYSLKHLLRFLKNVASYNSDNKMDENNLALMIAPNIFPSKTESTSKTCNSLVQLHTSVIKLLIENADHIGEVPQSVLLPDLGEKRGSEPLAAKILDSRASKLSRNLGTRPVKDLFLGMWKSVGQNAVTAPNLKTSIPETTWTSPNILCRQKSNSTSCQMERDLALFSSSDFNPDISYRRNSAFMVPTSSNESGRKSSAAQFEYDELNYEDVAVFNSECNLVTVSKESFNLSTSTPSLHCPDDNHYETLCWSPSSKNVKTEQLKTWQSERLYANIEYVKKSQNKSEGLEIKPDHFVELKLSSNHTLVNNSSYDQKQFSNSCVNLHQGKYFPSSSKWKNECKSKTNLCTKKPARHSSLIRGKPNTIKSGLPCQPWNKHPIPLQSLEINEEKTDNPCENNAIPVEINPSTDVSKGENEFFFSEQDTSSILNSANFNLSLLNANDTPERNNETFVISDSKKGQDSFTIIPSKKVLPLPLCSKNILNPSQSKIPRLKPSLGAHLKQVSEVSPDCKIENQKLRLSSSETSTGPSKIPVLSKSKLHLSDLEASLNDSCFLTPNNKPVRKSIQQILKNKSGHVSEKVKLYNTRSCSTPVGNYHERVPLENNRQRSSQKQLFTTPNNRKTLSVSQSCDATTSKRISNNKISNRISTPRKLPLTFPNLEMLCSQRNHSLKKVTNITFDGKQTTANDYGSQKPGAYSWQKSNNTDVNKLKQRRNTFSGNPSLKFSKRVSRSESSTSSPRPCNGLFKLFQESTLNNPNVPLEMNNVLNSSFSPIHSYSYKHAKKSGSSLSIQKLKLDEMIDEWQCKF